MRVRSEPVRPALVGHGILVCCSACLLLTKCRIRIIDIRLCGIVSYHIISYHVVSYHVVLY